MVSAGGRRLSLALFLCLAARLAFVFGADAQGQARAKPPIARLKPVVDDYFGSKITDPYRWMEAGASDPEFLAYLKAQNDYTRSLLGPLSAQRGKLLSRLRELDNAVASVSSPARAGNYVFFLETNPGRRTASLMVRDSAGSVRTLFDPESFAANDVHAAIDYFTPSDDGSLVIVGESLGGSENSTLRVVETKSGRLLPDTISRTQYAQPAWREDGKSFYYARLQALARDAPATAVYENERTFLHVLGTDPERDAAVFGPGVSAKVPIPLAGFTGVTTTPKSPYVIAFHSAGTTDPGDLYLAQVNRAADATTRWQKIITPADGVAPTDYPTAVHGSTLYLLIQKDHPNRSIVTVDMSQPYDSKRRIVLAESSRVLEDIYAAQDALYIVERVGGGFALARLSYDKPGAPEEVALPYQGAILSVDASVLNPGVVVVLGAWTRSQNAFVYDPQLNQMTDLAIMPKNPAESPAVEAREVLAPSTDGAQVPLSVICRKDIILDGSHPTLFEGYGAYGTSIDPSFDPRRLAWVERGGVFAYAHLRGGGEFGETWHLAGQKQTKQHTIDDMIAAARYLLAKGYTSPEHLAVRGTSAGGIAVGGAITQHPELFAAAIDNVGVTDTLRFQNTPGGAANVPEFGDVTKKDEYPWLFAMSAYHHIVPGTKYPAVMGTTGVNDPRVPTWIVAKFIAALQTATTADRPVLLRVDFDAGHGLGSSRTQREEQFADEWTFLLWQTGDLEFQPTE